MLVLPLFQEDIRRRLTARDDQVLLVKQPFVVAGEQGDPFQGALVFQAAPDAEGGGVQQWACPGGV
jgi:hypothetical protein